MTPDFNAMLDAVGDAGLYVSPGSVTGQWLIFDEMVEITSKFSKRSDGMIPAIKGRRVDGEAQFILRCGSHGLQVAFKKARDTSGIDYVPGTLFRVVVSGSGTNTSYLVHCRDPIT